ncbi:MAG: helix-turn-helix transcriptional regulator [Planctomycetota bacterium]|nr:helix-turn-helix transcriptional regulator [Planctomycetota bacterium]
MRLANLLGERIRALRRQMRLKQANFADIVGVSEDTIGLIERGKILPRMETISKIAEKLNLPIAKLLDFEKTSPDEKKTKQNSLSAINLYLKTKSPEQIQMVHDIARDIFDKHSPARVTYTKKSKTSIIRDK